MEESRIRRLMACLLVNRNDILCAMDQDWLAMYDRLQKRLRETNVAKDPSYQSTFRDFYRLRAIDSPSYFRILEREKDNLSVCFADVLREFPGTRVHFSFASKLVATVNPDNPVYDSRVYEVLAAHGLRLDTYFGSKREKKLEQTISNYRLLNETTGELVNHPDFSTLKTAFDKRFPCFSCFTDIKKLDLYMWWSGQG